jgi:hypothetical protein
MDNNFWYILNSYNNEVSGPYDTEQLANDNAHETDDDDDEGIWNFIDLSFELDLFLSTLLETEEQIDTLKSFVEESLWLENNNIINKSFLANLKMIILEVNSVYNKIEKILKMDG